MRNLAKPSRHIIVPVLSALALCLTAPLGAQTPTGSVSGSVTDTTGAPVANATVRIINAATQQTTTVNTNPSGAYLFPTVPAGSYTLEAEASGFKTEQRQGVKLDVNQNARADFMLQVGSMKEVVEVKGDVPMVDTMSVQLGDTVDRQRIEDLPLNGRNVYDLIRLMPGAVNVQDDPTGSNDANNMNVNGSRVRDNNFYLDGGANASQWRNGGNMSPNPDAVAEFHLITSNFDAEYGRQPGSVLNVVTRSGSNAFHGSLFEFLRNDAVDASNFFHNVSPPLKWNQFGGTFGGPVRRDKTFFFASYQGFREATSTSKNAILVPAVPQRTGDFSALAANKRPNDPLTKTPFPGGIIPASRLDPVVQNILKDLVPLPNDPTGTSWSGLESAPVTENQGMLRVDHQLTTANRLSGTLFLDRAVTVLPFANNAGSQLPHWAVTDSTFNQNNVVINDDHILKPNLILQSRFSYSLNDYAIIDTITTSWADWGSKIVLGATPPRPPRIAVTGGFTAGPGGGGNNSMPQSTWQASERISWVHGGHNIRAGVGYQWNHFREFGNWLGAGQVSFTGGFTGNGYADMDLGWAATFRQNNGLNRDFQQSSEFAFLQDNWKVFPRLTLDLGLRWEMNPPYTSAGNALGGFQFGVQSKMFPTAPLGMLFPGDPGVPAGIAPTIYTNFAPRVGFAWDVFGNGRTAIRGGYGMFYATGMVNLVSNLQNQPFIADITLNGTTNLVDPWAEFGGSPYPYTVNPQHPIFVTPLSQNYLGEGAGTPYVQEYNFMLQQQIGPRMSMQIGYVGNTGRKLYIQRDANMPVFTLTATAKNVPQRRPYLSDQFGGIFENETGANSNYNSLQISFTRRLSHNFSVMANYVWSKVLDVNDDQATSPSNVSLSDSNNFWRDYGPAGFNFPHYFKMSWIYTTPELHAFGWFGRHLLGGWGLNGITIARTGDSMNVTSGVDSNFDSINSTDRPNVVGDHNFSGSRTRAQQIAQFFNTAAFAKVPAGTPYGNTGRNVLFGPNRLNFDVAAMKDFRITEGSSLQFRTDFFNIFNQVNLNDPNTNLNNANFGKITGVASPRILQFGLKLRF